MFYNCGQVGHFCSGCAAPKKQENKKHPVNGHMLKGHAKANFPGTQDALHVDGCTLEGQTKAYQVHHSQEVLVVSPSSSYYVEGWVGIKPSQVFIDM